jgi:hypothetical protein
MRDLVEALCSTECAGRATGTQGGRKAMALVERALSEAGLRVERQAVPACDGVNLLAKVGAGPRWIIVAAHYDHLGQRGRDIFRGADDNAAAVAILVEVARGLAARPPLGRSVLIAAFDAEEPPHFLSDAMGSAHFCAQPPFPLESVDLMVCMDLVGHAIGPAGLPDAVRNSLFVLGTERSEGTGARLDALTRAVDGVIARRGDADVIPPLSDYWAFWRRQIPFALLTCGRWKHYHATTDTPDKLDFSKMAATAKWLELFVRDACARPEEKVRFTDTRDDASTLRSLIEMLGGVNAALVEAAQALLSGCDARGQHPDPSLIRALVMKIEAALA